MFATLTLFAARRGRGERFFNALGEGNLFAWAFVALAIVGLILMVRDHVRKKQNIPAPALSNNHAAGKSCPHCQEALRHNATFCRHCKNWLE